MPTNFLWGSRASSFNLLTTEMNSLANNSGTAFGGVIDISSGGTPGGQWQLMDVELLIASSSSAFTAASYVDVYFVTSADGTNYPKYTSGASWKLGENYWACRLNIHPATLSSEAIREVVREVRVPSGKFKTVLVNKTGVTLPATGNTLVGYPTPEQY